MSTTSPTLYTVNIFEAKTQLSKLVERVENGEEIIIARAGKPVARLTQLQPGKRPILFGLMKGEIQIVGDFDAPLPGEILSGFEDGPIFPPERPAAPGTNSIDNPARKA